MAKYYPTFSCGHEHEVVLFGPQKDRDRKLQWYRDSGLCPQCFKDKQAVEVESGSEGLPILAGTDKQIQWAAKIRADVIDYVQNKIREAKNTDEQKEGVTKIFLELCQSKTEAKWWIDNRDAHSTMKMLWTDVIKIAKERQLA